MRAVMISIQPKWCELIASGKKTVEVRKTRPKIQTPFKVYIYETQGRTETPFVDEEGHHIFKGRGQVIGEFVCDTIYDTRWVRDFERGNWFWDVKYIPEDDCLTPIELAKYIGDNEVYYGWHISNLVIYDKPKELSEFHYASVLHTNCFGKHTKRVTRPPQSWCFVERSEK